jgi:hypothetical protein
LKSRIIVVILASKMPAASNAMMRRECDVDAATKTCSYATIQSDSKGQFGEIVAHLESKTEEFRKCVDK